LTTSQKKAVVAAFEAVGVSERKAFIAVGLARCTHRHNGKNCTVGIRSAISRTEIVRLPWYKKMGGVMV